MSQLVFETDWGWMGIAASAKAIQQIILPRNSRQAVEEEFFLASSVSGNENGSAARSLLRRVAKQLEEYLRGRRTEFHVPLDFGRVTPFQHAIYEVTRKIPYGEVRSYGWLAEASGSPKAARAVGQCMARNPIPILVPCHRVIGSSGNLTGFGGGLDLKEKLLRLEGWPIDKSVEPLSLS